MRIIWLAGGCFWGVEAFFKQVKGVLDTTVGYGQGTQPNPTYEQVCTGETGHTEICEVIYDENALSLPKILELFFRIIDPTELNRQGNDRGTQYRTGVYYKDEFDFSIIHKFLEGIRGEFVKPIVVEVEPLRTFYSAEEYHQDYLQKNPRGYCHIDMGLIGLDERM